MAWRGMRMRMIAGGWTGTLWPMIPWTRPLEEGRCGTLSPLHCQYSQNRVYNPLLLCPTNGGKRGGNGGGGVDTRPRY